ncbi:DUF2147 domain-containing protein [Bradyrhizobium jicamae]|uniref:DUF2147 domain-containing protein n=1 Tax=Bradyrhizobium jicamae TaxID=280332 RepID=A0ABS5FPZ4_9BRAD|nr:DUF2147 domain-containing protein [Bradyrhizobium jicamae]MBR0798839.1 DUF2147 domain-containing protein [Bradyrhizobium jicamae]MBR0934731.1 DUF2147 domain-containing protein [Bradyrhizobium jicamae]
MKKLLAIATLLLASTAAAQAQYSFEYGGRTIRIDPDRGTVSIPGVYDNTGHRSRRAKGEDAERKKKPATAQEAKTDPQAAPASPPPAAAAPPAPAPVDQSAATTTPPPQAASPPSPAAAASEPAGTTVAVAPSEPAMAAPPPPAPPPAQQEAAPPPAVAPTVAAIPPAPAPAVPKPATSGAPAANSPLGVWLTEEKEGKVRIEQCGTNLCGYAVDKKSNENGEQVLINMKPGKDKWSGRILDPNTGSTYDSTIALKGSDILRVQGCAFGGMFCGGQTWTRVN